MVQNPHVISLVAQLVKNLPENKQKTTLPAMGETPVQFLGLEGPPGEGIDYPLQYSWASPGGSDGKASACKAGDLGSIPGLGRSPGGGHGNPLQYSCLENPHGQRSLVGYSPWGHRVRHS